MNKAALLAELRADPLMREVVPPGGNPELIETVGDVKKYLYHHLVVGIDDKGKAVAYKQFKPFYVYLEGAGGEEAYYERTAPENQVNFPAVSPTPATPTSIEMYRLYMSPKVREMVKGLLIRAANDVYWEAAGTPNHAQRLKWAVNVVASLDAMTNSAMAVIAVDQTSLAGNYTDVTLKNIINGCIDRWATTLYV